MFTIFTDRKVLSVSASKSMPLTTEIKLWLNLASWKPGLGKQSELAHSLLLLCLPYKCFAPCLWVTAVPSYHTGRPTHGLAMLYSTGCSSWLMWCDSSQACQSLSGMDRWTLGESSSPFTRLSWDHTAGGGHRQLQAPPTQRNKAQGKNEFCLPVLTQKIQEKTFLLAMWKEPIK